MEQSDQISSTFLPADDELLRRENIFLGLFDKYHVDEGSDADVVQDVTSSTVGGEGSSDSDSSCSETSGCEPEDNFDVEEVGKQLQPVIDARVNAWSEKGINFQLNTGDRDLTVEAWLAANQEFTTTTKKYKKTVINETNKTTTITTTRTKTTTNRTSVNVRRKPGYFAQVNETEVKRQTDQNYAPNDLISSKRFFLPGGKQSTPDRRNLKRLIVTPKAKRLSPQKMKPRNRKGSARTTSTSKSSNSDSGIFSNEISDELSNKAFDEVPNKALDEVSNKALDELSNKVYDEVSREVSGDAAVGCDNQNGLENPKFDHMNSDRPRKKVTSQLQRTQRKTALSKPRPPEIVIYSPGAGKRFGTRIDDEFMSVTKRDLKRGIDPKYHQYTDLSSMKKCIVPVNQRLVYVPPIDTAMETGTQNTDDSETDDDLLTSYTTTGHFYRLNSK